ncbi:MAG: cell envelope integrity protein TolA [Nitrospiraceae bacterium]|nr:cell envelope integrity protein TolA [Nitrospiraceae bacterium]
MKGPSLQKTAVVSAGLHLTFFLLAFVVLRQSNTIVMPSPYMVSLVSPGRSAGAQKASAPHETASVKPREADADVSQKAKEEPGFDEKKAEKLIGERIAALQAKQRIKKIVEIRREIGSMRGRGDTKNTSAAPRTSAAGGGQGQEATYIDRITGEIHDEWQWPDYMKKDLEAVVSIKIQRDGTISDVRFEKKSGDHFFDRAALQAIAKASPVTPPPYEMEIGLRFYP